MEIHNPFLAELAQARNHPDEWSFEFRWGYTHKYAWSCPTPSALKKIKAFSPEGIVEVGAGTGYWAYVLRQMGVEIVCFDLHPVEKGNNRHHRDVTSWTHIRKGYSTAARDYPDRVLFLSWPPWKVPMASRALASYKGEKLIYVGQPSGGLTGDERFHETLARSWRLVDRLRLRNFKGIQDSLYLYERS